MDAIKVVIEQLNRPPFSHNLNLLSYDALGSEQRLDLLVQVLNAIDPKLGLVSVRVGNTEEIVASVLDTLRIFKYSPPPHQVNPSHFRRDLILADKDLLINILEWLLKRLPALKKRAYLARFLVKVELSPDVESDQEVQSVYGQYTQCIEDFKRAHGDYEARKKSLDSLIELQKDIRSMELEREQIAGRLDVVKRRASVDRTDSAGVTLPAVLGFVADRRRKEKYQVQLAEQRKRIESSREGIEDQARAVSELRQSAESLLGEGQSADGVLARLREDVSVKTRLARDVLAAELAQMRSLVDEAQSVESQPDSVLRDYLAKVKGQIESTGSEVRLGLEKNLAEKDSEEDRLSHFRQNAQSVAARREETWRRHSHLAARVESAARESASLRAEWREGDLPLHGEALPLYLERMARRETEMGQRDGELARLGAEVGQLEAKVRHLRQQEASLAGELARLEEVAGLEGFAAISVDQLRPDGTEQESSSEQVSASIAQLESRAESVKSRYGPVTRQVKQMKQSQRELETDFDMKKRLYDSAAAGLEIQLGQAQVQLADLRARRHQLQLDLAFEEALLAANQAQRDQLVSGGQSWLEKVEAELGAERERHLGLKQRGQSAAEKEDYLRRQIGMWRDVKAILEAKCRAMVLGRGEGEKGSYNHLVVNHLAQ